MNDGGPNNSKSTRSGGIMDEQGDKVKERVAGWHPPLVDLWYVCGPIRRVSARGPMHLAATPLLVGTRVIVMCATCCPEQPRSFTASRTQIESPRAENNGGAINQGIVYIRSATLPTLHVVLVSGNSHQGT